MPTLEIAAIVLLTIANGVFAMAEIAVVSARRGRLNVRAQEGSKGAKIALELATNPNDFLSTVQVGITLIGTLAGAFGGATLAEEMAVHLNGVPWIAPHGETVANICTAASPAGGCSRSCLGQSQHVISQNADFTGVCWWKWERSV